MRNVILKHGKKVDKFIMQNVFMKGLVVAFLFVVLLSMHLSIACGWRELGKTKEKLKIIEHEMLYNSVAAGSEEEKTFVLKDDLTDDKYNIKGSPYTAYNHVYGYINLGKTHDNRTLRWRIVGNETEKDNKYDIILQATEPIISAPYNATTNDKTFNGETVWASHYGASDVRALLNNMTNGTNNNYFTSGEIGIMNDTTLGTTNSRPNPDEKYYLTDKLYLPGGGNGGTKISVGAGANIDIDGGYFDKYDSWTRSDNGYSTQVAYAHYWYDTSDHTKVLLKDVTESIGVKPFVNVDLNSVYFASTVKAATATETITFGTTSMYTGLNLRFNGGDKLGNGKVEYNNSTVTYSGNAGQTVVVQGEDSVKGHWYYSEYISSDVNGVTITPDKIVNALSLATQPDFEQCNIWIEQTNEDGLVYARMATVEINQLVYEGISGNNPTGFIDNNNNQIQKAYLDKLGISAKIDGEGKHVITMNGFRVHSSMSDPLKILNRITSSVTIDLIGNNSIESKGGTAVWSQGLVTFTGTGNLTSIATTGQDCRGLAIDAGITFNHTGTIIVYGREGLRTNGNNRTIAVNSGNVITTGIRGTDTYDLIINGGDIKAYALSGNGAEALYASNKIEINGGRVYAQVDRYGIRCNNLVINNGSVDIYGDNKGDAKGMYITGTGAEIKGGNVTVKMNENASSSEYSSDGIYMSSGTLNITSGELNIKNGAKGYGIYNTGTINIGDSTENTATIDDPIICITKNRSNDQAGIFATSDINVYGGTTTIGDPNSEYNFEYGIDSNGKITVYDGEILSHGYRIGIDTTGMDMQGGYVFAKTTSDGSIRMDRRSIVVNNSFEMSDGHVEVELIGQRGVGLMVDASWGTTHITGGYIEAKVEGMYTKGMRIRGTLIIGTLGTEGPTIIINGDIQNEQESWGINYDESGLFVENDVVINSGNVKIDMKNSNAVDMNNPSNPANNYIAAIMATKGGNENANIGITINGGTIDLNVDVEQPDGSFSGGDGMFTYGYITINGGRIVSKTNGGVYWVNGELYHSAGIDAKKDLTITGGEVHAINTNVSNEYNVNGTDVLIGRGLYSDEDIIVSGGHVIAQGINQALAGANTNISKPQDLEGELSILASRSYNGNPLIDYESTYNDEYKYIEIGVRHGYFLRYDEMARQIFKGDKVNGIDVTLGDDTNADSTDDTEDKLAALGISVNSTTGVITFNNAIFESSTKYGLYIDGNATIYLKDNTVSRISANKENDGEDEVGIYCTGTLTISGPGELIVSGATKAMEATTAINLTQAGGDVDYDNIVLHGSTTSTHEFDLIYYPNMSDVSRWNFYKYVRIGSLPAYYFRYNVSEGKMYKMVGETATPITKNQVVYGWNISNNTLYLDDFNFVTSAANAVEIISSNASDVAHVDIEDDCTIKTLHDKYNEYNGIKCNIGARFTGTGTLDIAREYEFMDVSIINDTNEYTGLNINGDLTITSGTYNITGESYGIKVAENKKLTVNNATITAKASVGGAIYLSGANATSDVYEKVQVANNLEGGTVDTITDYDTNFASYNTKKYIKMEPAVVSVNITWGDMNYVGENIWDPSTHTYSSEIRPASENSGQIRVVNDSSSGSNVPIKASIDLKMYDNNDYGIEGTLNNGTDLGNGIISTGIKLVGLDGELESELTIEPTKMISEGIDATVGTVSVILKDYRK